MSNYSYWSYVFFTIYVKIIDNLVSSSQNDICNNVLRVNNFFLHCDKFFRNLFPVLFSVLAENVIQ